MKKKQSHIMLPCIYTPPLWMSGTLFASSILTPILFIILLIAIVHQLFQKKKIINKFTKMLIVFLLICVIVAFSIFLFINYQQNSTNDLRLKC